MSGGTYESSVVPGSYVVWSCPPPIRGLADYAEPSQRTPDSYVASSEASWHHGRMIGNGSARPDLTGTVGQEDSSFLPEPELLFTQFEAAMEDREFSPYARYALAIRDHFNFRLEQLQRDLATDFTGTIRASQAARAASPLVRVPDTIRRHRLISSLTVTVALVLLLGIYVSFGGPFFVALNASKNINKGWIAAGIVMLIALIALVVAVTNWYSVIRISAVKSAAEAQKARISYDQEQARQVAEAIRRSINDVFRDSTVVNFPLFAPTLVELSNAKIVSSATQTDIVDFISHHEASAIGVAGSRGSGKSTLMRAIAGAENSATATKLATHTVILSAPVKYEPLDFTRLLLREVAKEILRKGGVDPNYERDLRQRRLHKARFRRDLLTALIFAVLIVIILWQFLVKNELWSWSTATELVLAATLILLAATPFASAMFYLVRAFVPESGQQQHRELSVRAAVRVIEDLDWEVEQGQKEKSRLSLLAGMLAFDGEDSTSLTHREQSLADLVGDFRELLTLFSEEATAGPDKIFVIFIDELDKIAHTKDLIKVINGIKDLLHIPKVHFVVSVSVDALSRFEERGIPARDAFDSAFDVIVPVQRLSLSESLDILTARAAAFPALLAMACHAWSGGLARDLLRMARNCVTIARNTEKRMQDADGGVQVEEILRASITEDLNVHLQNAMRESDIAAEDLEVLASYRATVQDVARGADVATALRTVHIDDPAYAALYAVELGLAIMTCLSTSDSRSIELELERRIEALARAKAAISEPAPIRRQAFQLAMSEVLGDSGNEETEKLDGLHVTG